MLKRSHKKFLDTLLPEYKPDGCQCKVSIKIWTKLGDARNVCLCESLAYLDKRHKKEESKRLIKFQKSIVKTICGKKIEKLLKGNKGMSISDMADKMGCSYTEVFWEVKKLKKSGLIVEGKE